MSLFIMSHVLTIFSEGIYLFVQFSLFSKVPDSGYETITCIVPLLVFRVHMYSSRDFPRANLGPIIGPYFFPNRDRNSQIL